MNSINHLSSLIDYSVLDEEEVVPIVLYASLTMMPRKQLLLTRVVIIAAPIIVKAIMVQASLVIIVEAIRMPVQTAAAAVSMVMISINAVVFLVNPAIHRQGVVVRLWGRRVIVNCMLWVRRRLHIHRCHACVNVAIEIL